MTATDKTPLDIDFFEISEVNTLVEILMFFNEFIYIEENKAFYRLIDGYWQKIGDNYINQQADKFAKPRLFKYNKSVLGDIITLLKARCHHTKEEFDTHHHLINCNNGIFNMKTLEFRYHTTIKADKYYQYYPFIKIESDYNPKAKCPTIDKFFTELFGKHRLPHIYEIIGTYITTENVFQKWQFFYGSGKNGKGVIAKLLKALLGGRNVISMTLSDLMGDMFAIQNTEGKLLLIVSDVGYKSINEKGSGIIKSFTGSDDMNARVMYVQGRYDFYNTCKLCVFGNRVPESKDDSSGWWRRPDMLHMPKQWKKRAADLRLIDKLTTKEELSGLLNKAINGLIRLNWRGYYKSQPEEVVREKWMLESKPLGKFIMDYCSKSGTVERGVLLDAYIKFRRENNHQPYRVGERYLTQNLQTALPDVKLIRKRGNKPAKYDGISLAENKLSVDNLFTSNDWLDEEIDYE